jgi:acyl-CoA thioesterase-1
MFLLAPALAGAVPRILVLGDSLSAAYGIPARLGWVALLEKRLAERGLPQDVVNASISGETTRGGLTRLPDALARHHPSVVVVALGGNDGLRGFGPGQTRDHLARMVDLARDAGAEVLLLGVHLPGNYGKTFRAKFHEVYHDVARDKGVALVPFFLEGVAEDRAMMQADGIHPDVAAQPRILENVWPALEPLL